MSLYIEIENGQIKSQPAFEENLVQAFGCVPENWEPFVRVEMPKIGPYDILESDQPVYTKVGGTWTNGWAIRAMTDDEKTAKQQAVISAFNAREQAENWSAWTLNEVTCTMQPPIPCPAFEQAKINQSIQTFWCGAENNWKDTPARPEGKYEFDFLAWQWIQVADH